MVIKFIEIGHPKGGPFLRKPARCDRPNVRLIVAVRDRLVSHWMSELLTWLFVNLNFLARKDEC